MYPYGEGMADGAKIHVRTLYVQDKVYGLGFSISNSPLCEQRWDRSTRRVGKDFSQCLCDR